MRLRKIVHKNSGGFAHRCNSIFLYLSVGRENSFGEALDHGPGKGEVLLLEISGGISIAGLIGGDGQLDEVERERRERQWHHLLRC